MKKTPLEFFFVRVHFVAFVILTAILPWSISGTCRLIKSRVKRIKIFAVQLILYMSQRLTKALEMHDFPCTQIADRIAHFWIFYDAKNVIIGAACLLFWCDCVKTTMRF